MTLSLKKALILCSLMLPSFVNAYPGMEKQQGQPQSSISQINILPKAFPVDSVPFKNAAGESVDFDQYRGKVIMVNMWATWCPPCVRELPAIERLSKKFDKTKFEVLPVSIDLDGKKKVEPFLKELGMEGFTSYYDEQQSLGQVFPLDTIPATFILNKEGELIAFVRTFVDWDDKLAIELIETLIEQQTETSDKTAQKNSSIKE